MDIPFSIEELESFMKAAIEYADIGDDTFYSGNVGGRQGLSTDAETIRRIADWLANTDNGILERKGLGFDNITYYRLGLHARRIMREGGMAAYFKKRRRTEQVEDFRAWAPICAALLSIVFACLTYFAPKKIDRKMDELGKQIDTIKLEKEQIAKTLTMLRTRLDSLTLYVHKSKYKK